MGSLHPTLLRREHTLDFDHVDWDLIRDAAGGGFGITFIVLILLSLSTWVAGLAIRRVEHKKEEKDTREKR